MSNIDKGGGGREADTTMRARAAEQTLAHALAHTRERELDCDELLLHVADYLDSGIDDEELEELVEQHLSICPDCREAVEILRRALGRTE